LVPPSAIANPETVLRQPGPNGQADMRVVVDNQNTTHNGLLAARVPALGFDGADFLPRISAQVSFRPQMRPASALHRVLEPLAKCRIAKLQRKVNICAPADKSGTGVEARPIELPPFRQEN
jgi:hypothetical protein